MEEETLLSEGPKSYLPSLWERIKSIWRIFRRVLHPPLFVWGEGDVLFVLDAIEAYEDLFDKESMRRLQMLIKSARMEAVPIVFTRWGRTGCEREDAVDAKAHWSNYVPKGKTNFLPNLVQEDEDETAVVLFPNALTNLGVNDIVTGGGCNRMVLAGCWTESCIYHTAHESLPVTHFPPAVIKDACVGHQPDSFISLMRIQECVGDVYRIF